MEKTLSLISTLNYNNNSVNSFGILPSNNIISISSEGKIIIFDNKYYQIIQTIRLDHNNIIFDISIKDENNFATCSNDKSIKTWLKSQDNKYELNHNISDIHENDIHKIIFLEDNSIISGSRDEKIKILKLINNKYICNIILNHNAPVYSILYIKEENILISSGTKSTLFWNLNDVLNSLIISVNAFCYGKNALRKIDNERFVVGGSEKIQILSIKKKEIIKEIESDFLVWAICIIKDRKLFLCGGVSNNIMIFNSDNYDKNLIINCHNDNIRSISLLNDGKIITGSEDNKTKIWEIFIDDNNNK